MLNLCLACTKYNSKENSSGSFFLFYKIANLRCMYCSDTKNIFVFKNIWRYLASVPMSLGALLQKYYLKICIFEEGNFKIINLTVF